MESAKKNKSSNNSPTALIPEKTKTKTKKKKKGGHKKKGTRNVVHIGQGRSLSGAPSTFNRAIADDVCYRIAQGEMVLNICADPDYPSQANIYMWLKAGEEVLNGIRPKEKPIGGIEASEFVRFFKNYVTARKLASHTYAEKSVLANLQAREDINALECKMEFTEDGKRAGMVDNTRLATPIVSSGRFVGQAYQWYAGKSLPEVYGERQQIDVHKTETLEIRSGETDLVAEVSRQVAARMTGGAADVPRIDDIVEGELIEDPEAEVEIERRAREKDK